MKKLNWKSLGMLATLVGFFLFVAAPSSFSYSLDSKSSTLLMENDSDKDGVPDLDEYGPNRDDPAFDGNNDGTPDHQQRSVVSFPSWNRNKYVTLFLPEPAYFSSAANLDPSEIKPQLEGKDFQFGFYMLTVKGIRKGAPIIIRAVLHEDITPTQFYLYTPLDKGDPPSLVPFGYNCDIGAEWYEGVILIHLVDGFSGDRDLVANEEITLLGGPVFGALPEKYFFPESTSEFSFHTHQSAKVISIHLDPESQGHISMILVEHINGDIAMEKTLSEEGIREYDLDVSSLQCGLYKLVVYSEKTTLMKKILITE